MEAVKRADQWHEMYVDLMDRTDGTKERKEEVAIRKKARQMREQIELEVKKRLRTPES